MWCGRDKCTSQSVWDQNSEFAPNVPTQKKKLIFVTSVFLSLWSCSTESPEHILDGTGYTSKWLIPSDSVWWREKWHIAQASIKLPLRGLLFLYFSFLFNQDENSEREGKAAPLSSVKALCMQRAALQVFITSLGTESLCARVFPRQPEVPWRGRRELWRHLPAGRDCSWGRRSWDRTEATLGFFGFPSSDISWHSKAHLRVQCWQHTERGGGKKNKIPAREILSRQAARMRQTWKLLPSFRLLR